MKHHALLVAAAALALTAAACDNDPSKGKARATVSAPAPTAAVPASAVPYTFSSADSNVAFVGAKVTRKHDGSFQTFTGSVNLVDNNPELSRVTAEIDVGSLRTDEEKLTGHLKSSDLLDVAKHPKAKFVSTSIKRREGEAFAVTGNLELHGVTKSISFPATIKAEGDAVAVDAEFAINRKDFGIVYPGMPDDLIKDEVLLKLKVRATKAAQKNVAL